jgi:hypothetical protein
MVSAKYFIYITGINPYRSTVKIKFPLVIARGNYKSLEGKRSFRHLRISNRELSMDFSKQTSRSWVLTEDSFCHSMVPIIALIHFKTGNISSSLRDMTENRDEHEQPNK